MIWGCKVPILLLYISLFDIKRWLKISSYAIIIVTGVIFLITSGFLTARCSGELDVMLLMRRCQDSTTRTAFALGLVSIITDVLIFVLPISIIVRLHLPVHKRLGIALVFAGGLV
jgi:hypothetical protein